MSTEFVRIVEVGPRDGLQNEKALVGTAVTLLLVAAMIPWQRLTGSWTS